MKLNKLSEILTIQGLPETVSFDLFDTLIERAHLTVSEVHDAVSGYVISAANFAPDITPGRLTNIRYQTTNYLKQSQAANTEEPTLFDIWQSILLSQPMTSEQRKLVVDNAIALEIELERSNLRPCSDTISTLEVLKSKGHRLIAISDMYFSEQVISELLANLGIRKYMHRVYVSASAKKTKQTGNLFLAAIEHTERSSTIHIGDNHHSDYEKPTELCIRSIHLEKTIPPTSHSTQKEQNRDIRENIMQLSIIFLFRVFAKAQQQGIQSVYFAGRDASTLLKLTNTNAFRSLTSQYFPNINTLELGISRATTTWLSIDECLQPKEQAMQALARARHLLQEGFEFQQINQLFDTKIFSENEEIPSTTEPNDPLWTESTIEKINSAWQNKKQQTLQYLKEAKLIDDGKKMVVDVGYSGTSLRDINYCLVRRNCFNQTGHQATQIFLCMLAEGPNAEFNARLSAPYVEFLNLYTIRQANLPEILKGNFSWLECFFKDHHRGPLTGYKEVDGRLTPNYPTIESAFAHSASTLLSENADYGETAHFLAFALSDRTHPTVIETLHRFAHPDQTLLEAMHLLTSEADAASGKMRSIVYRNPNLNLIKLIKQTNAMDYWMSGTLKMNGYGWFTRFYQPTKRIHKVIKRIRTINTQKAKIKISKIASHINALRTRRFQ